MKVEYIVAIVLVAVILALAGMNAYERMKVRRLESRLEESENDLTNTKKRLETSEAMCNYERAKSSRSEQAIEQFETARQKIFNPTEKVKEIEHDETSCNWLDAVLPDSIRLCFDKTATGTVCE